MEGWELDGSIYPVAREHMGLQQLEDSGALVSPQTCKAQLPSRIRLAGCVKPCITLLQALCQKTALVSALHACHEFGMQQCIVTFTLHGSYPCTHFYMPHRQA